MLYVLLCFCTFVLVVLCNMVTSQVSISINKILTLVLNTYLLTCMIDDLDLDLGSHYNEIWQMIFLCPQEVSVENKLSSLHRSFFHETLESLTHFWTVPNKIRYGPIFGTVPIMYNRTVKRGEGRFCRFSGRCSEHQKWLFTAHTLY